MSDNPSASSQQAVSPVPASIPSANGPELWDAILARMPAGSVIAGGAVRDYLLGFAPKDIDVFTGFPVDGNPSDYLDFTPSDPRYGLFRIENEHERFEEYAAVSNILCVSSGTLLGVKVDAVLIENFESGEKLIEDFDFGITRCWYDGEIHDTTQAQHDRANRCITLLSDEREARSLVRFERLNKRWGGDWTLIRDAQAIEARRAETLGSVHESAVPTGCAESPRS
jgi:hypothetical protein